MPGKRSPAPQIEPLLPDAASEPWSEIRKDVREILWANGYLTVAQVAALPIPAMRGLGIAKKQAQRVRKLIPRAVRMVPVETHREMPELGDLTPKQMRETVRSALRESFRGRIGTLEGLADQRKNMRVALNALRMMAEYGVGSQADDGSVLDEQGVRGLVHALALATEPFIRESDREGLETAWGGVLRQHLPVS